MSSLISHLENFERFRGDVAFVHRRGLRRESWTYGRVLTGAAQFAHELDARGIRKGDHVVLWASSCAEWVAAFFGCMLRGVIAVPLDRVGHCDFAERVSRQVNSKLTITSSDLPQIPGVPTIFVEDLCQVVSSRPDSIEPIELSADDSLQIIFTSGTTGEPRGVVITHANVLANVAPFAREIDKYRKYERIFHPIRFLDSVPLSHVFGQMMALWITPLIGGTTVFHESFNPAQTLEMIRNERISVVVAVPRLVEGLRARISAELDAKHGAGWTEHQLAQTADEHFAKRWWRFRDAHNRLGWKFWAIISGGATLDSATEEFFRRISLVVLQGYGLTETTSLISVNHPFKRGAGSVGKVLPGREMKLSDTGEILVRGESIASKYVESTGMRPVTGEEGWFHTGDLGEVDSDGYIHFRGRAKNVIVTPEGMKVYPEDVERAVREQAGVRDCVVIGVGRGGNAETCAVILARDGVVRASDVVRAANAGLAPYQQIRHTYMWPDRDLPRTSTGKPKLAEIRTQVENALFAGKSPTPTGAIAEMLQSIRKGAPPAQAQLDSDLALSSIERVELMSALEEKYGVQLNETTFAEAQTVSDVEQIVQSAEPDRARTEYHYPRWAQRALMQWMRVAVYYLLSWPATFILANPGIRGRERLRDLRGPVLVIANHLTFVDIGFVLWALPPRIRHRLAVGMEGERLRTIRQGSDVTPMLRWVSSIVYWLILALFNAFPLPKLSGFRESFAYAGESMNRGYSVLVFPEGRRSRSGELQPFLSGSGILAEGLNVPVVPVYIKGLWQAKQRNRLWARSAKIEVIVGDPVRFTHESPEEITAELERRVRELASL
jgi:long-chain acyl-CoA synthetase